MRNGPRGTLLSRFIYLCGHQHPCAGWRACCDRPTTNGERKCPDGRRHPSIPDKLVNWLKSDVYIGSSILHLFLGPSQEHDDAYLGGGSQRAGHRVELGLAVWNVAQPQHSIRTPDCAWFGRPHIDSVLLGVSYTVYSSPWIHHAFSWHPSNGGYRQRHHDIQGLTNHA